MAAAFAHPRACVGTLFASTGWEATHNLAEVSAFFAQLRIPAPDVSAVLAHPEGAGHTVCMITPENAASIAVAIKCDYVENGRATYKGHEAVLFQRAAQRGRRA
jgi:uncharacterized membrane protein YphA (DoxX/SURF4 family)